ncbi:replicative DNA helicase [Pseudomonas sp. PLMAX]|jgi:replicative DNA helicase|uniref:replicative DNA helicase n=1 Tax=Pseudomonas sp. PLMAX TaxID=2201998 RepID=UPI0038B7DFFD
MTSFVDANGVANFKERAAPLEKSIIATLLDEPSLHEQVAEFIEVGDFFNDAARQVYAWLHGERKLHNPVSAVLALSRFASLAFVESYLMETLSELPAPASVAKMAEELREIAVRRNAVQDMQQTVVDLVQFKSSVEDGLSKMALGVQVANQRLASNGDTIRSYGDVCDQWMIEFQERASGKALPGVPTGFTHLDDLLAGLQPADLVIIGGRPSMGKTTFAMNIIEYVSLVLNESTMVFSLEMPSVSIFQRSVASVGEIDFEDLRRGKLKIGDLEKLKLASERLKKAPIFIDDSAGLTLEQLCARAIRQFKKKPFKLIMIDYLQLMRFSSIYAGNPNLGVGEISRGLKQLGKLLGVPIIVLSQLSRDLERRPNKRPMPADLRDSGSIEQDADVIAFVYRDEVYNPETEHKGVAEIIIAKQRNGPLGTVYLDFKNGQSCFKNLDSSTAQHLAENKPKPQHPQRKGKEKVEQLPSASSFAEIGDSDDFLQRTGETMPWDAPPSEQSDRDDEWIPL